MAEINLLQTQIKDTQAISSNRNTLFLWSTVVLEIFLIILGAGFYFFTNSAMKKTDEVIVANQELDLKIASASKNLNEAKAFQAKLSNIDLLLDQHIVLNPLLAELEKVTYQKSQYIAADIQVSGRKVHLEGDVPTYSDLGKLMLGLTTSEYFSNVRLLAVVPSSSSNTYHFSINLELIGNIFDPRP